MQFQKQKVINNSPEKQKSRKRNFVLGVLLGIFGTCIILGIAAIVLTHLPDFKINTKGFSVLSLLGGKKSDVDEITEDKINILVTGIGGENHDGPELTDTIIMASYSQKYKTVSLFSVPRDLYVKYPSGGAGKINELYMQGIKNFGPEKGFSYLRDKVEEITGEKISHALVVDFDGFIELVDILGGIEVNVPEDLTDTSYPDNNWGYTTFAIKKGLQTLDGATALKYARSRHSTNDFDRSLRQQLIIKAIKEKMLQANILLNPMKIQAIISTLSGHIKTDMTMNRMISLAFAMKEVPSKNILSYNLNDSCFQGLAYCNRGGLLYTPLRELFHGASVLLPEGGSAGKLSEYSLINQYANIAINYPKVGIEQYPVHIVNATKISGIAQKEALFLKKLGFAIPDKNSIWSTKTKYKKSEIRYLKSIQAPQASASGTTTDEETTTQNTDKELPQTVSALASVIIADVKPVDTLEYAKDPNAKIEIILGDDAKLLLKNK